MDPKGPVLVNLTTWIDLFLGISLHIDEIASFPEYIEMPFLA